MVLILFAFERIAAEAPAISSRLVAIARDVVFADLFDIHMPRGTASGLLATATLAEVPPAGMRHVCLQGDYTRGPTGGLQECSGGEPQTRASRLDLKKAGFYGLEAPNTQAAVHTGQHTLFAGPSTGAD